MPNVMKIKYTDATIKQLAKAKAQSAHAINRFYDGGDTYDEILLCLKYDEQKMPKPLKTYDQWGRPNIRGKEIRNSWLKKFGLNENASIEELFEKEFQKSCEIVKEVITRVHKNFDGSYSQIN